MEEGGVREATAGANKREGTRTALAVYCESIREAGMLVVVFASLDALFSPQRVSSYWLIVWIAVGVGMVYAGVRYDPEVQR
jgi:hypothetical protein